MKLSKPGWLLDQLGDHLSQKPTFLKKENNTEKLIYQIIQPTGLIYGHTVKDNYGTLDRELQEKHKTKAVFVCALHDIYSIYNNYSRQEDIDEFSKDIHKFYRLLMPEIINKSNLKTTDSKSIQAERILNARLTTGKKWYHTFINKLFFNNFLYLDLIAYTFYKSGVYNLEQIRDHRNKICEIGLKIIAISAHADGKLQTQEKQLYTSFLQSALLPKQVRKDLKKDIKQVHSLCDLPNLTESRWLVRKFLLDIAVLTITSDKVVDETENLFLFQLCKKLDLTNDELQHSLLAINGFVLDHFDKLTYLQTETFDIVKDKYLEQLSKFMEINKKRISQEISESKELVELLKKNHLSPKEKEKVRQQISDVLKTIPLFVIIALPFTFITLPILLSILPKTALPTAFHKDEKAA